MPYKDPEKKREEKRRYQKNLKTRNPELYAKHLEKKRLQSKERWKRIVADPDSMQSRQIRRKQSDKAYIDALKADPEKWAEKKEKSRVYDHLRALPKEQANLSTANLDDTYIRKRLKLKKSEAPAELIELKRQIMLLKRACIPSNPYHHHHGGQISRSQGTETDP